MESLAGYAYDDKHDGKHEDGRHDDLYPHGNKHGKHDKDAAFAYQIVETDRTFTYDDAGKLLSAAEAEDNQGTYVYTYEYDMMGNRTAVIKTNEAGEVVESRKYVYNESNQLVSAEHYNGGKNSAGKKTTSVSYTYDADGNLTAKTGWDGTDKVELTYTYTVENRLEAVYDGQELLMAAAYDGDGNRVFQLNYNLHTDEDWKGNSGNGNGSNKDNAGSGNSNSSGNGNGKNKGNSDSSTRSGNAANAETDNSQNQCGILFPISGETGDTEEYLIGLIKTSGKEKNYELIEYINDVNREYTEVLVEQNINGALDTAYVYGAAIGIGSDRLSLDRFDGSTGYYLYDPKGSVTGITNEEGQVYQSYRYSVFGEITFGAPQYENEYTYNGESYNPNIKSQYLRARYYCVVTADFLTEDSYLGNIREPLTLNRYNYCVGNPENYADPSGNRPIIEWFKKIWNGLFGDSNEYEVSYLNPQPITTPSPEPEPWLQTKLWGEQSDLYGYCSDILPAGGIGYALQAPGGQSEEYIKYLEQQIANAEENSKNELCEPEEYNIVNLREKFQELALEDPTLASIGDFMREYYTEDVIAFLQEMANRESYGGDYSATRGTDTIYLGKYQLGDVALEDIDFAKKPKKKGEDYIWTEKANIYGIHSNQEFLDTPIAQEVAMVLILRKNYSYVLSRGQDKYIGQKISWKNAEGEEKEVTITLSGLLAASHLVGNGELNKGFTGKMEWAEVKDGNHIPALDYMDEMGGFNLDVLLGGIN